MPYHSKYVEIFYYVERKVYRLRAKKSLLANYPNLFGEGLKALNLQEEYPDKGEAQIASANLGQWVSDRIFG